MSTLNPNPFSTPTPSVHTPPKRMASTALPPAAPYEGVAKPWTQKPNPRGVFSYYLTWALLFVGAGLGGVQSYFSYHNVRLDREPLCLVFSEDFNSGDDAAVFGTDGQNGRWLREVQMDGFGNGEFEMTTGSSNNSFLLDGNLTDCTFNLTATDGGYVDGEFDFGGYFTACSRTTNSTAGSIINPVQSARLSTLLSARRANASADARAAAESALNRGSIRYGKIEVRAKMPRGDWLWPAIWLLPVNDTYGPWPASGEIDIVESRGNGLAYTARGSNYVQGSLNWGPTVGLNSVSKTYSYWEDRRTPFSNDFHTYTLEWTDSWLRVSVDTRLHTLLDIPFWKSGFWKRGDFPATTKDATSGQTIVLEDPWANGTRATPFDQDFYLIMNVAVGGTNGWFPDGQGNKPWLNQAGNPMQDFINGKAQWLPTWPENALDRGMAVDYVRMYKHCADP
ncbi:Glucan 1,3-beta-glucosidase [Mycena sanguinolenta]|uniref:Glucan 1,3-beta-glucosidase n=1 Tax=Mycena sanguinolenta TaxID=230812 RepID=A0A8H6ZDP5_9AGAR|nr:Glucan 1,3-beta-glucosidase [Mycena sanguinolenta]